MKSERRHELQENSLIRGVRQLPDYWKEQGSKVMLAVIAVLLVVVLVRWWYNQKTEKAQQIAYDLTGAQSLLAQWRDSNQAAVAARSAEQFNSQRKDVQGRIEQSVADVLSRSQDPAQQAEAKLIRADLYWQLAQAGDPPAAATQPSARMAQKPAELMESASKDYNDVLNQQSALPPRMAAHARFGLAAVAEDKNDWAAARGQYEAIQQNDRVPKSMRELAKNRLELLPKLQEPVLLGHPRRSEDLLGPIGPAGPLGPTTGPTTLPAFGPFLPTTPATEPAGPSTQPTAPMGPTSAPAGVPATGSPATGPATQPTAG